MKKITVMIIALCAMFFSSAYAEKGVLMVLTSHSKLGETERKTGFWLSELTHPYYVLLDAGYKIDVASIDGGMAPVDPRSLDHSDSVNQRFFNDAGLMRKVIDTIKLDDVDARDYRAIVFSGGHGTMWDFPKSEVLNRITASIYDHNGVVAAVCHGPVALVNVILKNGKSLVEGKSFAAFTNEEEQRVGLENVVPFLLQTRLQALGGVHVSAKPWSENVVVDRRLVTGQNPQSAHRLGELVVAELKKLQ